MVLPIKLKENLARVQYVVRVIDLVDLAHDFNLRLIQRQRQIAPASCADAVLAGDHTFKERLRE